MMYMASERRRSTVGDLAARARRIACAEGDTVARLGGDEFVADLPIWSNQSTAKDLIDRLLSVIAQPVKVDGVVVQGFRQHRDFPPHPQSDDTDPDQLSAPGGPSDVPGQGRGQEPLPYFDAARDASLRGQHEHLERIRGGINQNEFVLRYQPRSTAAQRRVIGPGP